jgi:RNA polymerase sigma-70 factor (ECF subfamily)
MNPEEGVLATQIELSEFLKKNERKAFKQALYMVQDEATALDIVQDAMIKLMENYSNRPVEELTPLFVRIVHNQITDHFRKQKSRSWWTPLFGSFRGRDSNEEENEVDLIEALAFEHNGQPQNTTEDALNQSQNLKLIEQALEKLPPRQRQAFLLRYWEEMDTAETAEIMGISEGSVKTHCSRAVHALSKLLKDRGLNHE